MKTFFTHTDYAYSYVKNPNWSRLKLRVTSDKLKAFRSGAGRRLEMFVDICSQGSGWYEITAKESNPLDHVFGTITDGLAVWLRAWNLHHLSTQNANPVPFQTQRVKRVHHEIAPVINAVKFQKLRDRWVSLPKSKSMQREQAFA